VVSNANSRPFILDFSFSKVSDFQPKIGHFWKRKIRIVVTGIFSLVRSRAVSIIPNHKLAYSPAFVAVAVDGAGGLYSGY